MPSRNRYHAPPLPGSPRGGDGARVIRPLIVVVGLAVAAPVRPSHAHQRLDRRRRGQRRQRMRRRSAATDDTWPSRRRRPTWWPATPTGSPTSSCATATPMPTASSTRPAAVATTRLSVGPGGVQGDGVSINPVITPDGRYVCFISTASTLVPGTPGGVFQVYRAGSRQRPALTLVSASNAGLAGNADSLSPSISDDGEWVAFQSTSSNWVHLLPAAADVPGLPAVRAAQHPAAAVARHRPADAFHRSDRRSRWLAGRVSIRPGPAGRAHLPARDLRTGRRLSAPPRRRPQLGVGAIVGVRAAGDRTDPVRTCGDSR